MRYRFDCFTFDPDGGLSRDGTPIPLERQAFELLRYLLDHREKVVTKDELIELLWDGRAVSDAALTTQVRTVRRVLGDDRDQQRFVKTFPKRGYQFAAPVERLDAPDAPDALPAALVRPAAPVRRRRRRPALIAAASATFAVLVLGTIALLLDGEPSARDVPAPRSLSIAVLPFDNLSGDSSKDYLADAFTEDLITDLSRIRDAFVISRSTTFTYRGKEVDAASLAEELGVRYVLEGSLRIDGDRARINAQLIDGSTNSHLWSDRFDRPLAELFRVRDAVTGHIASALRAELRVADDRRQNPEATRSAWDYALRGNVILFNHQSIADYQEAHALLTEAVARDPAISSAWSGLAFIHLVAADAAIPGVSRPDSAALSLEAALKAVEADPMNAEPYWLVGAGYARNGQPERGMGACETAIDLNPNMDCGYVCAGLVHMASGEPEQAVPLFRYALKLNPRFRPFTKEKYLGLAHIQSGEYEMAIAALNRALAKAPKDTFANLALIAALALDGQVAAAREAQRRFSQESDGTPPTVSSLRGTVQWMGPNIERLFEGLRVAGLSET